ncbi:MAG TPA: hypothetical protein VK738_14450 [Terriglobales bacterium]|nr:hypothetical protein [Terriglobales bacterium]
MKSPRVVMLLFSIVLLASMAAAQNQNLTSDGVTALSSPLSGAPVADDLFSKPSHEVDGRVGPTVPNAVLTVPGPVPQGAPAPAANSFGFNGISHFDQRTAGTGIYKNTQFSVEPPDQGLAAGNGFILEDVNDALAVYNQRTHALLVGPTPVNQFFKRTPAIIRSSPPVFGDSLTDPKAYFDPQTRRWFVTILEIDTNPATGATQKHSHLLLAVSKTPDPTGLFNLFSIDVTDDGTNGTPSHPNCPCFGDQPLLGANADGIFISTNEFGLSVGFNGAQIYALGKEELAEGDAPAVVHLDNLPFPEGIPFSLQPAVVRSHDSEDDDSRGVEFLLSVPNITLLFDNRLAVWSLSNTRSLRSNSPHLTLNHVVISSETFGVPNDAEQKAGPTPLGTALGEPEELVATNDQRMNQVMLVDGELWGALTTSVSQGPNCVTGFESDCKAGIAWFRVRPRFDDNTLQAEVRHQGYISVQGENVMYPSVAIGEDGRGIIAFALSGHDFFPSTAFARISHSGTGPVRIAAAGVAPEDGFSGYFAFGGAGSGRWGDYTAAAVVDENNIWFATEYIPGGVRTVLADWGTFIGRVRVDEDEE